jgi:hypothetical protein
VFTPSSTPQILIGPASDTGKRSNKVFLRPLPWNSDNFVDRAAGYKRRIDAWRRSHTLAAAACGAVIGGLLPLPTLLRTGVSIHYPHGLHYTDTPTLISRRCDGSSWCTTADTIVVVCTVFLCLATAVTCAILAGGYYERSSLFALLHLAPEGDELALTNDTSSSISGGASSAGSWYGKYVKFLAW